MRMGSFEYYKACICYDFPNEERIIFEQVIKTTPDKIARRDSSEACPDIRCRITVRNTDSFHLPPTTFKHSIFNDKEVFTRLGNISKELGYSFYKPSAEFKEARIFFPRLDCIICANSYGCTFRSPVTCEPLSQMGVEVFNKYEKGSLYLILQKMLTMVEWHYNVNLDMCDFL